VIFTDALPRTASGQVLKSELRSRFTQVEGGHHADNR
jgi:acyl-coenzyme A synthetase/AMP-(fatty) acid ligase